jgi:hypothetical protein
MINALMSEVMRSTDDMEERYNMAAFMHHASLEYAKKYLNLPDITCEDLSKHADNMVVLD